MKKRLTQKQLNFTHEYIKNGGNGVQAALDIYNTTSYKTASKIADTNKKNSHIQQIIEKALNKKEVTLDRIVGVIGDGLDANLGDSKLPDHNTRLKFLDTTVDLLGLRKNPTKIKEETYSGVLSVEQIDSIRVRMR